MITEYLAAAGILQDEVDHLFRFHHLRHVRTVTNMLVLLEGLLCDNTSQVHNSYQQTTDKMVRELSTVA